MRIRLLGPMELLVGRKPVHLGGPRQRIVLGVLALNANRVTPVQALVEALWAESPPSTARAQVQTCISALRKLFAVEAGRADAIRTRPPGYLLDIPASDLDSQEFTDLVAAARAEAERDQVEQAAATLRRALELWRGPMLADLDSDLVRRGAAAFEAGRLSAIEERIRLDLLLGRHEAVSGELAALAEEFPYNERLCELRMLALYRSGRQAEALEVGRRTRDTLVAELGVEPGPDLRNLTAAILSGDRALDLEPVEREPEPPVERFEATLVPRQLPASIADFTGRDAHIAEIKAMVAAEQDPGAYAMRIVGISGKGGVGKSSLAVRVAHELRELFPDGQLYGDLQNSAGEDDPAATVLARFLRSLGVSGADVPDDPRERAELYRSTLADKRVLVVLDDVTGEEQIQSLLPGSATCAVIATSRIRLSGLFGAHLVDIDVLDTETSTGLLAKIVGPARVLAEPVAARELVALCGGLPLALRIAAARLASRPHWRIAALVARLEDEAGRLDQFTYRGVGLRFNIDLTYRGLPERAKRLLRLFALLRTQSLPAWVAAALLDTDLDDAEDVLEHLVEARLLDVVDQQGEHLRYRFHSLIRIYAAERLMETESVEERDRVLARVLGAWLALAEDAHRDEYGGDYTVLHGGAPRWRAPGAPDRARPADAMDWWDSERATLVDAVRQAAAAGMDELCWDLALTSVTLFEVKGYYDYWRETTTLGLEVTARAGNRNGRAAMLYSLGTLDLAQKRLPDAERRFAEALEVFTEVGNDHGRALVLRNSALVDGLHGDTGAMLAKYHESLDLLRAVGDRMGEAQVLRNLATFHAEEGEVTAAHELFEQSLAICREVGCLRGEAQVLYRLANSHLQTGQVEAGRRELARVRDIVHRIGDRVGETYAQYGLGVAFSKEGRLDDAETSLHRALSLAKAFGERLVEGQVLHALGELGLVRGDATVGAGYLADAGGLFEELGSTLWHAKTLILQSGLRADGANQTIARERVGRARSLLRGLESKEAARLLTQLDTATDA